MKLLSLTEKIKLTKQQELEFIDVLEDDIKKYFRIPIFFIMLFQIYNMIYVSVYTDLPIIPSQVRFICFYTHSCLSSVS